MRSGVKSYQTLFQEDLDFKKGDEARTVYSPAAYLTDLVQMIDDQFQKDNQDDESPSIESDEERHQATLHYRRSDIKNIILNGDNTFDQLPYLDIVNDILRQKIQNPNTGQDVREMLKTTNYPFNLPVNFEYERLKKYTGFLDVREDELEDLFSVSMNLDSRARQVLGLSQEESDYILRDQSMHLQQLNVAFNLDEGEELSATLSEVSRFLKSTELDGVELRTLLFQNLSTNPLSDKVDAEESMARHFFINAGLHGYATLETTRDDLPEEDSNKEKIVWKTAAMEGQASLPDAWFDRCNRFIRLARKTGFSFNDLDLILRTCSGNVLNRDTLQILAAIKQIHLESELPIDVICALMNDMNTVGMGNEDEPIDLFNRTFNGRLAALDDSYVVPSDFIPDELKRKIGHEKVKALIQNGNILDEKNKLFRRRLQKSLLISDTQIIAVIEQYRARWTADSPHPLLGEDVRLGGLSLIYRTIKLSEMLDISASELFDLFDLLELDPMIHDSNPFGIGLPFSVSERDCFRIFELHSHISAERQSASKALLWLVQTVVAMVKWMQKHDFTTSDLKFIQSGAHANDQLATAAKTQALSRFGQVFLPFAPRTTRKSIAQSDDQVSVKLAEGAQAQAVNLFNQVVRTFLPFAFESAYLVSENIDARSARVVTDTLKSLQPSIVSSVDDRVLRFDREIAPGAIYEALQNLSTFTRADFEGLGLAENLTDKLYDNLILHGYLSADGFIVKEKLPETAHEFGLVTDFTAEEFSGLGANLFELLNDLYQRELQTLSTSPSVDQDLDELDISVSFFKSDHEWLTLSLTQAQRLELYDNLIFNGYIDESGRVLNPSFFADSYNEPDFRINIIVDQFQTEPVYDLLKSRFTKYERSDYIFHPEIFEDIGLTEREVEALLENLRFNDIVGESVDYIVNGSLTYLDKRTLAALTNTEFKLALVFYPYKKKILAAIQADLEIDRREYYLVTREDVGVVAESIAAAICFERLHDDYLVESKIAPQWATFFSLPENSQDFDLGSYLSPEFSQVIFHVVQTIQRQSEKFRLVTNALNDVDLYWEEADDLVSILIESELLDINGFIPSDKHTYFANMNNALDFQVEGYDDYNKDVFFALHAVIRNVRAAQEDMTAALKTLAANQKEAVYTSLAEGLEIESETLEAIVGHLIHQSVCPAEALLMPILAMSDAEDSIKTRTLRPSHEFGHFYRRLNQFVHLVRHLKLDVDDVEVVFQDQNLVEKLPETIVLPEELTQFDALLSGLDDSIYLFKGNLYWRYALGTSELWDEEQALPLSKLSPLFANITQVDAAFFDPEGHPWIIAGQEYFVREIDDKNWKVAEKTWGKMDNAFATTEKIDSAYSTLEGATFLFSGEQYVRYSTSNFDRVDSGYPRSIGANWSQEQAAGQLPVEFSEGVDASFENSEYQTYLFKADKYIQVDRHHRDGYDDPVALDIVESWGKVNTNFDNLSALDSAFSHDGFVYLFSGDQVVRYSDQVENSDVSIDEGFPLRLKTFMPDLSEEFAYGIDGIFQGADDKIHVFKNNQYAKFSGVLETIDLISVTGNANEPIARTSKKEDEGEILNRWGLVRNSIQMNERIDAAFTGLDGCTYLFCANQYVRYSGRDYTRVDEGFPRTIASNWGGLEGVAAAFILDGKTYLFSEDNAKYVRYSTNDYTTVDDGYPKPIDQEQWWNLPVSLTQAGFAEPDAIFIGSDNTRYLLKGDSYIEFDHLQRWWSEPEKIRTKWNGLTSSQVNAAFTGRDGKTYLFTASEFVCYSHPEFTRLDDRYPRKTSSYWGHVVNQIERTRRIDSALMVVSDVISLDSDDNEITTQVKHTYLFAGNQYFRYENDKYDYVEEGYPRSIKTSLREEPRFKHLPASVSSGIDAAFADQRHVYLLQGDRLHILAADEYRRYENFSSKEPVAAFMDEGSLYIEHAEGWHRTNNPEMDIIQQTRELPPVLRSVPPSYQTRLDAILRGTDKNLYVFRNQNCYNSRVDRTYPVSEEWGVVRNWITRKSQVDAAFVGLDERVYLFSGDQFVSYLPGEVVDVELNQHFIDGLPQLITGYWGGLSHVNIAFVREGQTYLLEKPNEFGEFRYITCSLTDYASLSDAEIQIADFGWWEIPESYQENGFVQVDALLTDDENLFLIQGREFIQYNQKDDIWTYPKPIDRLWRGLELDEADFGSITAAFENRAGKVYFFSSDSFTAITHDIENPVPNPTHAPVHKIGEHWGRVDNEFAKRGVIDAAFVWDNQETYLFSGNQFVKYSTNDYRYVDAGYPKSIGQALRLEPIFQNLPATFEAEMIALAEKGVDTQNQGIRGVVANKGTIYLLVGKNLHAVTVQSSRSCSISALGKMKNRIFQRKRIDAAYLDSDKQVTLFAGDQFFRYSDQSFEYVDEGYPLKISDLLAEMGADDLKNNTFAFDLDAAVESPGEKKTLYLFKDKEYIGSDAPTQVLAINSFWGAVQNNFGPHPVAQVDVVSDAEDSTGETNISIDTVFIAPDGMTYVFKGNQYIRYAHFDNEFVDEGFPQLIKDNWGHIPEHFEEGIDGGFVFDNKTYLLHNGTRRNEELLTEGADNVSLDAEYVRYSRADYSQVDNIYPQKVAERWQHRGDFLLGDLRTISYYKNLQNEYSGSKYQLSDLFNRKAGQKAKPYQILEEIFGWDSSEIMWLKRHNTFLQISDRTSGTLGASLENSFQLETIEKMVQIFETTRKLGVEPSVVFSEIWQTLYDPSRDGELDIGTAADHLYRYLGTKNSPQDWAILKTQIHDELNLLERDIWVPLALAQNRSLERPKDLFELLLIDVEMGNAARTSKIKEAISAIQLYLHRYLVNLESLTTDESQAEREQFKERWKWLKNYRLWEANRKVFLYPENFIRPELRDTKTPEFEKLEEILLQGELNAGTAEAAFSAYLEGFGTVGNLKIAGANVYSEGKEKVLMLFGHTRLDPHEYFYRTAKFTRLSDSDATESGDPVDETVVTHESLDNSVDVNDILDDDVVNDQVEWSAWEKVDVSIASGRVFPIHANGRLMVFWIEIEDIEEPEAKFRTRNDDDEQVSEVNTTTRKLRHEASVKYSLLKYNGHWTPAQELKQRIKLDYEIDAAYCIDDDVIVTFVGGYCLKTSNEHPDGEMRRIEQFEEFKNLPYDFKEGIDAATVFNGKLFLFKGNQCVIQETGQAGSNQGRRLAGPISTGKLLNMPVGMFSMIVAPGIFHVSHRVVQEEAQNVSLIEKGVYAAFTIPVGAVDNDDVIVLVNSEGKYTFFTENINNAKGSGSNGITLSPIQTLEILNLKIPNFNLFIATLVNRGGIFRPADAVFKREDVYFVLRDGQYECYNDIAGTLIPLDGFPKAIRGNLSFNMDMFFNKLHLQNTYNAVDTSADRDSRSIYISYTSPKDSLKLYGKLKSDFTFQEIPYEQDSTLLGVFNWQDILRSRIPELPSIQASVVLDVDSRKPALLEIKSKVDVLIDLDEFQENLDDIMVIGNELLKFSPNEGESTARLAEIKKRFDKAIGKILDVESGTATRNSEFNFEILQLSDNDPYKFVVKYSKVMDKFYASIGEEDNESEEEVATSNTDHGSELAESISRAIDKQKSTIKSEVKRSHPEPDMIDAFSQQNELVAALHLQTVNSYSVRFGEKFEKLFPEWNRQKFEEIVATAKAETKTALDESKSTLATRSDDAFDDLSLASFNRLRSLPRMSENLDLLIESLTVDAIADVIHAMEITNAEFMVELNKIREKSEKTIALKARHAREALLGTFDLFPERFGIANSTSFAFSEVNSADWHVFEAKGGTFLCRPLSSEDDSKYEIIRLTTSVIPHFSQILFSKGIMGFLSADTQSTDDTPSFGGQNGIQFNSITEGESQEVTPIDFHLDDDHLKVFHVPVSDNLDFEGASGIYYAELFFHAPYLIAQTLNNAQKFDEAKIWYERIFDPTLVSGTTGAPWQYYPFQQGVNKGDVFLSDRTQIKRHLDDPFDPHAIARLRPAAYRKAIVMSYIDNLLDWGDMLFRQYSVESINEARMLYVLANDLLGTRPENLGPLHLSEAQPLMNLANTVHDDFVIEPTGVDSEHALIGRSQISATGMPPHISVGNRYFFVPENSLFGDYWSRIDDRLHKIRHSLNLDGEAQPLALFQPPIDPMAIVQAVAGGASLGQLMAGASIDVPHYRFEFIAYRAQNLVQKLNQYGGELLGTLEKKDAEALSLMQNRQEGQVLNLMIDIRTAQVNEADQTIFNLEESQRHAQERIDLYNKWLADGKLPEEIHQINLMIAASVSHYAGSLLKLGSMIANLAPNATIGPFSMGVTIGGSNFGESLSSGAELAESIGEGLSVTGEVLATEAQIKHMIEDWDVQLMIAESEHKQIEHQLEGARIQKMIAQYELGVLQREIENNQSIQTFMREKFTNQQLYQWMIGKMSGLFFQTYQMAFDMAKMAEKAFQFERGLEERDVAFIQGGYWDSRHQGLLAGEQLALDLDRMEQEFMVKNERRLEITKEISLLELDPRAFLRLKQHGSCEFSLDESFFDYDFPGHYGRQIKTIELKFDVEEGTTVNATLTQLNHQTVLKPDPKAVKFLLDPKDQPPTTIRSNWRGNQQIILSHSGEYEKNNGMFELRYDTDNYLPFEGTGAVSRWRLELNGKQGSLDLRELVDAIVGIQYTARQGGAVFAEAVKGMLKPYQTTRFFDMTFDFANEWNEFLDGNEEELELDFTREHFPNMSSSKINGIFARYELAEAGQASMTLNGVSEWELDNNAFTETNGLSISSRGSKMQFDYSGSKDNLRNMQLVFVYKAAVG